MVGSHVSPSDSRKEWVFGISIADAEITTVDIVRHDGTDILVLFSNVH
jgi:hypothetical protein